VKAPVAGLVAVLAWGASSGCGTPRTATQAGGSAGGTGGAGGTVQSSGSGEAGGETSSGPIDFCKGCALQAACATFANGDIDEASGLAASALHSGVYYLHNDSGDSSRFFASNCAGDDLGTFELKNAGNVDWEDMARGPCDGQSCLFFADTGDNLESRKDYAVYRVLEPAALGEGTYKVASQKFPFVYPDGSHDAETLLVHPITGEIVVVTKLKQAGKSGVYAFPAPLQPGVLVTLTKVGEVAPPTGSVRLTGGSVHPSGEGILLRTYTSLFFYPMAKEQTLAQGLAASPCDMPVMLELQGESVTWTASGRGYVTASEKTGQSLHFAACK
jgi:hypothetical protein